jgi:hypothetical protein
MVNSVVRPLVQRASRALAALLLPLAILAGTDASASLFRCTMDGSIRSASCCPTEKPQAPELREASGCCTRIAIDHPGEDSAPGDGTVAVAMPAPSSAASQWVPLVRALPRVAPRDFRSRTGPPLFLEHCALLI